jgi:hypothetical protein
MRIIDKEILTSRLSFVIAATAMFVSPAAGRAADFPVLGGSLLQIMRVSVSAAPPGPCRAAVSFRVGALPPGPPTRVLDLAPGGAGVVDLPLGPFATSLGARVEVQPIVSVVDGACSAAVETIELLTARTTAYLRLSTPAGPPAEPPPDPDFAPLGVVLGQVGRLGVVAQPTSSLPINTLPPGPCRGTLAFFDVTGAQMAASGPFDLSDGQRAFLDFNPRQNVGSVVPSQRTTVQPRIIPDSDGSLAGCSASVQLFESSTGWTTEVVSGR